MFPPTADGNKYREPQADNMPRERNLETLNHKWNASIKSVPLELREHCGRGGIKSVGARGDTKKTRPFKSTRAKLIRIRRDLSSDYRANVDLYQVLSVYIIASKGTSKRNRLIGRLLAISEVNPRSSQ